MKRSGKLGSAKRKLKLDHTGYYLLNVKPHAGTIKLHVAAKKGTRSGLALVGRIGPVNAGTVVRDVKYLPNGGSGTVSLPDGKRFSRVTAVVVNADGRLNGGGAYAHDGVRYTAKVG